MIWLTSSWKREVRVWRRWPCRRPQCPGGAATHHLHQLGHGHLELDDDGVRDVLDGTDELVVALKEGRVEPVLGLGAAAACGGQGRVSGRGGRCRLRGSSTLCGETWSDWAAVPRWVSVLRCPNCLPPCDAWGEAKPRLVGGGVS